MGGYMNSQKGEERLINQWMDEWMDGWLVLERFTLKMSVGKEGFLREPFLPGRRKEVLMV